MIASFFSIVGAVMRLPQALLEIFLTKIRNAGDVYSLSDSPNHSAIAFLTICYNKNMGYDNIYKKNSNVWGDKPNALLQEVYDKAVNTADFLDLGCGQGRDSLFMLQKGFTVTAVDKSQEGINKINGYIKNSKLPLDRITLICEDVENFKIKKNKFAIINAFNVLQFLPKIDALSVVERIKKGLISGGYVIISGFIDSGPLFKKNNQDNGFFKERELKNLFSDFKMILYEEKVINDPGHPGWPEPHQHSVVKMIAKKI